MRVAVAGLGLIGGSIARALSAAGHEVVGIDRPGVLRLARAAGVVSEGHPELWGIAADIVVLAAPPDVNIGLLNALAPATVATDVTSVKRPICAAARRLGLRNFVGGHPMAGSERSGFAASSPDLFARRPWILTPEGGSAAAVRTVRKLVRQMGARVAILRASDHDRSVAFLSHVPQVVAWALLGAALSDPVAGRLLHLAGPGFRDMTRLASSPPELWAGILAQNEGEVARALRAFVRSLTSSFPPARGSSSARQDRRPRPSASPSRRAATSRAR